MSYRRRTNFNYPTKVLIHWSHKASAYSLKWQDTKHWTEMQIFIAYLKSLPYGDYEYDPDNKTWFFMEKYLPVIKEMFDTLKTTGAFDVDFQEKMEGWSFADNKDIDLPKYLDLFKDITQTDPRVVNYDEAKKIYRRACLRLHPDRGGDAQQMSSLNEAWLHIEQTHYKMKKEVEYANN